MRTHAISESMIQVLLGKTLRAGPLPSLSYHSFTRFAASNASLEPVENEESSMTSQRAFNTTEEDGQLHAATDRNVAIVNFDPSPYIRIVQ